MNFINYQQMVCDVHAWSNQLPDDLVAVAGVPRSGVLPASILALHRNIHLVSIDQLAGGIRPWEQSLRRGVSAKSAGRTLVLEDSINGGSTIRSVREKLSDVDELLFGALYHREPRPPEVNVFFRHVPHPRCYEWNVFHCDHMHSACLDMDGVLCEDWNGYEEDQGPGRKQYLDHLETAQPRYLPSVPVLAIVTARLEKYRAQTMDWLRRHRVIYGNLVMSPHPTAQSRRSAADHALRKATYYRDQPQGKLFIESSPQQASTIARLSAKPVLCSESMELVK